MESCLEELDDDIFLEDLDCPDIEELGLVDCLPGIINNVCEE